MTALWWHCFSGIAGDMALGSLVDAGADLDEVRELCRRLPVPGWELDAESVLRCGIAGTKMHVRARESTVVRTAGHINALVEEARLPTRVRARALLVFNALAEAEGRLHRKPPAQVHFHEVGGIDAIVDIVGTCAALEVLGIDTIESSPVVHGLGMVRAAHGLLPNPAPAVVELLRGAPVRAIDLPMELTTPTGAAIVAALADGWGPLPAMTIERTGFGAGGREIDGRPNLLQAVIGTLADAGPSALPESQPVVLLEANVDDATGEVLAHAIGALLDAGAHDAWVTPILMKKGRPAHTVSALADVALAGQIAGVLTDETGSLGVRGQRLDRWPSARQIGEVTVDGLPVRVKVSPGRVKAEFDDAARASARSGRPVREVLSAAEEAWRARTGGSGLLGGGPELDDPGSIPNHSHDHAPDDHTHPHEEGPSDPAS